MIEHSKPRAAHLAQPSRPHPPQPAIQRVAGYCHAPDAAYDEACSPVMVLFRRLSLPLRLGSGRAVVPRVSHGTADEVRRMYYSRLKSRT